jgi:hypothetical protein
MNRLLDYKVCVVRLKIIKVYLSGKVIQSTALESVGMPGSLALLEPLAFETNAPPVCPKSPRSNSGSKFETPPEFVAIPSGGRASVILRTDQTPTTNLK